jgi:hypothetical protein
MKTLSAFAFALVVATGAALTQGSGGTDTARVGRILARILPP